MFLVIFHLWLGYPDADAPCSLHSLSDIKSVSACLLGLSSLAIKIMLLIILVLVPLSDAETQTLYRVSPQVIMESSWLTLHVGTNESSVDWLLHSSAEYCCNYQTFIVLLSESIEWKYINLKPTISYPTLDNYGVLPTHRVCWLPLDEFWLLGFSLGMGKFHLPFAVFW